MPSKIIGVCLLLFGVAVQAQEDKEKKVLTHVDENNILECKSFARKEVQSIIEDVERNSSYSLDEERIQKLETSIFTLCLKKIYLEI